MATTFPELMDYLKTIDEISLLEILDINSEDLVDRFQDKIEERFDQLVEDLEEEQETE